MITSLTTKIGNLIIFPIKKHLSIGVSSFVLLFVFLGSANSQSLFRSNGVLTTASNYSTNNLPSSSIDVKLTTTTTSLDLSLSSLSMRSLNTVSGLSYTLNYATNSSSNSSLTLGGSNFANSVSGIANDLIYVGSGSLNISGTNTGGGTGVNNLNFASVGQLNVASGASLAIGAPAGCTISGAKIIKTGGGTLNINGINTNSGGLALYAGTTNLNNAYALGLGRFDLNNGVSFDNRSGSTLQLLNNNSQQWNGAFTFLGSNDLNLGYGYVNVGSNISLTTNGSSNLTIGGVVNGNNYSLTKLGSGTLTLSNTLNYMSKIILTSGVLNINNPFSLSNGTFSIGDLTTIDNTSGSSITNHNGNAVANSWGGRFTFIGTYDFNLGTGGVALTANSKITTNHGTFTVGGIINGAYSLSKDGIGTLTLSGANTFSGGMSLSGGTLNINNASALGSGTFTIGNLTTINNTSGVAITNNQNNVQTWVSSFTFSGSSNLNLGTGAVTLNSNTTITAAASTLTVGGVIGGSYNLTKDGNGTLALNGANSYTGSTSIIAGILQSGIANAIPSGSNLILNGGSFRTGSGVGFNEGTAISPMGTLTLSANSTIALGTGSHKLYLSDSHSTSWTGATTLTITGWAGVAGPGGAGTAGRIFVGSSSSGLTAGQLSQITFSGFASGASITSNGEIVPGASPTITTTGVLSALTSTYGTASSTTSFTVFGTNIASGIVIIPVAGFEVSQTSSSTGFAGSGGTITVAASAGVVSTTTIYVRLAAGVSVGTYAGSIKCQSSLSSPVLTKTVTTVSSTISKKSITAFGNLFFSNKNYDGTTTATPTSGSASLQTFEALGTGTTADGIPYIGDVVSLTGVAAYNYNSANVTSATTITESGLTLTGAQSGNYTLVAPTFSATITAATIIVTPNVSQTKVFGTSDPTFTYVASPSVTITGALSRVSGENVGTYSYMLGTLSAGSNYTLVLGGSNTFAITPVSLTITANDRNTAYGTSLPLGNSAFSAIGLLPGDAVNSVTLLYTSLSTVPSTVPASTYSNSIVPSAATGTGLSNYSITYINGTLTVTGIGGTWTGLTNTDYGTGSNWSDGNVPLNSAAVSIPLVSNLPVLGGDFTVASLSLASSATISLNGHSLTVTGVVTTGSNTSYFIASKLTSSSLVVGGGTIYFDPINNTLSNLTTTGSTTLGNALNITGILTPSSGTFTTGGYLTLKSTSETNTAVVGVVGVGGSVSGNVTVERFIQQGLRTFRDLCPEVSGAGSVFANWQESGAYNNGYGVYITGIKGYYGGVSPTTGFDISSTGAGSMQTYSNDTAKWSYITSTKGLSLSPYLGYRLLIRGDRTAGKLYDAQPTNMWGNATLRTTGSLVTGTISYTSTGANGSMKVLNSSTQGYSFVGNPYPCPIDWNTITKSNLSTTYLYFDPTFVNSSGNSTYVSYNATTGTSSNPGPTNVNQYIQPGQAFWVQNDNSGNPPSLTIKENDKVPSLAYETAIFGTNYINRIAFSLFKGGGKVDAAVVVFKSGFTNRIGEEDSRKFNNGGENLTLLNNGVDLSIEGTSLPKDGDILQLHLYNLNAETNYQLKVDPSLFRSEGTTAYLYDALLKTKVSLGTVTSIVDFKTTSDIASYSNRFSIIFYAQQKNVGTSSSILLQTSSLKVSPNPVVGSSFILHLGTLQSGKYSLCVYNELGLKVYASNIVHSSTDTHLVQLGKKLSIGTYIVKVVDSSDKCFQTLFTIAK